VSSKDFDVGAYLGFWAFAMVVSAVMFFFTVGIGPAIIYAVIFYVLFRFFSSVNRGEAKKQKRREWRRSQRRWRWKWSR
jgi:phosphotransferase system  glucose/maltose/N-acetylglucosamine-specific IIC component